MNCGCIYDGEGGDTKTLKQKVVRAKKSHECGECGAEIAPGDKYESFTGVYEGDFFTHKTCEDCLSVRREFFCAGYTLGLIWGLVSDHIEYVGGGISSSCLLRLTPMARDKIIDAIDAYWGRA